MIDKKGQNKNKYAIMLLSSLNNFKFRNSSKNILNSAITTK